MSEAKPTPGPWVAVGTGGPWEQRLNIRAAHWGCVASVGVDPSMPHWDGPQRANARLIADAGTVFHTTGLTPSQLVERVKELEAVLVRWLGPADDPNVGWRGTRGTDVLFACEHCHATSEDYTKIEHADDCPITLGRAALSKARPNTAEGE